MQDWANVNKQVWIIIEGSLTREGPFTVKGRRADNNTKKWKYDLVDAQGNKRMGVLESQLKRSGTDEESDNGGVGSSAPTLSGA